MKSIHTILSLLFLAACAAGVEQTSQRVVSVEGNRLQITSGIIPGTGRYVTIDNLDKRWVGKWKGGKEKWGLRAGMLDGMAKREIGTICGDWFYHVVRRPVYGMMDKDETMGGLAPVLGVTAAMAAHLAASSATDPANIPVNIYTEFGCARDER